MAATLLSSRRRPAPPGRYLCLLLLLLLAAAVFPQSSTCRPLPPTTSHGVGRDTGDVALPAGQRRVSALAADRSGHQWLLDMKPKGIAVPPSAPSKRIN